MPTQDAKCVSWGAETRARLIRARELRAAMLGRPLTYAEATDSAMVRWALGAVVSVLAGVAEDRAELPPDTPGERSVTVRLPAPLFEALVARAEREASPGENPSEAVDRLVIALLDPFGVLRA